MARPDDHVPDNWEREITAVLRAALRGQRKPVKRRRAPDDPVSRRQRRQLARMWWKVLVTPGTKWQVDEEQDAVAADTPITPLPRDFGLGACLPITQESRPGALDAGLKPTHLCTIADLRAAEAVDVVMGVGRAGSIMAYRHMREHGRLDFVLAIEELGCSDWLDDVPTEESGP